jgi:hypothetical protein
VPTKAARNAATGVTAAAAAAAVIMMCINRAAGDRAR